MTSAGCGVLHGAHPGGVVTCVRQCHEVGATARPTAARRAGRGRTYRPAARARRLGGDLRVARDPDRHGLAGPGAGAGPLRGPGPDRAEQSPGQAVPARDRRSRHARVRQPAHRGRRGIAPLHHARSRRANARRRRPRRRAGCCRPRPSVASPAVAPCWSTGPCLRCGCSSGPGGCRGATVQVSVRVGSRDGWRRRVPGGATGAGPLLGQRRSCALVARSAARSNSSAASANRPSRSSRSPRTLESRW